MQLDGGDVQRRLCWMFSETCESPGLCWEDLWATNNWRTKNQGRPAN